MKLFKHLLVVPGIILLLATLCLADTYFLKSGDTTPEIDVEMWDSATGATCAVIIDPNDVTVYYTEEGAAQESYADAVECTSEAAAWVTKSCISRPSKNSMRICLPTDAVDGGVGKYVKVWVTTGTYEGSATILLGAPVNAYLSDGTTPPTINVSSGIVEANVKEVDAGAETEIAGAVWNALRASYTLADSFGLLLGCTIPIPPSGSYDWLVSTEDVARVSTQTTLYYSGSDNAFIQPGAVLAVKNSAGFYEKPVVGSVNTGTDTITFSTGMIAPPADGESVYLVETSKYGVWLKSIIRSVLNSL